MLVSAPDLSAVIAKRGLEAEIKGLLWPYPDRLVTQTLHGDSKKLDDSGSDDGGYMDAFRRNLDRLFEREHARFLEHITQSSTHHTSSITFKTHLMLQPTPICVWIWNQLILPTNARSATRRSRNMVQTPVPTTFVLPVLIVFSPKFVPIVDKFFNFILSRMYFSIHQLLLQMSNNSSTLVSSNFQIGESVSMLKYRNFFFFYNYNAG